MNDATTWLIKELLTHKIPFKCDYYRNDNRLIILEVLNQKLEIDVTNYSLSESRHDPYPYTFDVYLNYEKGEIFGKLSSFYNLLKLLSNWIKDKYNFRQLEYCWQQAFINADLVKPITEYKFND